MAEVSGCVPCSLVLPFAWWLRSTGSQIFLTDAAAISLTAFESNRRTTVRITERYDVPLNFRLNCRFMIDEKVGQSQWAGFGARP